MPRICLALLLAGASLFAAAPPATPLDDQVEAEIRLLRGDVQAGSRMVINDNMALTPQEAVAFWPIYDDYEVKSAKLGDARVAAIRSYLDNYDQMTPELTQAIADKVFSFQADRIKLARTTYKKVAKALTPKMAARFLQIDAALRSIIDLQVQAGLPLFK